MKFLIVAVDLLHSTIVGKTRGIGACRKLKSHRQTQRRANKSYNKCHLGDKWNKPFVGSFHGNNIFQIF